MVGPYNYKFAHIDNFNEHIGCMPKRIIIHPVKLHRQFRLEWGMVGWRVACFKGKLFIKVGPDPENKTRNGRIGWPGTDFPCPK